MKYDCIIIGAGNGGLTSALTLQKQGKQVLILESGRLPGGLASSFKRGNYEFDTSLGILGNYGPFDNKGSLNLLFERLDISIPMKELKEEFHLLTLETNENYVLPTGIDNFINKMEEYVPGSRESLVSFFDLCREVHHAMEYLETGNVDENVLKEKYSNFLMVSSYNVEQVLKKLDIPSKAIEILSSYWIYLGSSIQNLSFVHFALRVYSTVNYAPVVPINTSHNISVSLSEKFIDLGGTIHYLSPVTKIEVANDEVVSVVTKKGERFETNHVISSASPNMVYGNFIDENLVPKQAKQLTNSRTLGGRGISVYLGLNQSMEELNLTSNHYLIYHTLDSEKEYNRMKELFNGNMMVMVYDNPAKAGTTIVTLKSFVIGDSFDKVVTKDNYIELKEKIAESLIHSFEVAVKSSIVDAIEEIEIETPVTIARYSGSPSGSVYGYLAFKSDNLLPRLLNEDNEIYIKGLRFCGSFASYLSGNDATYLNGESVALKTLKESANEEV